MRLLQRTAISFGLLSPLILFAGSHTEGDGGPQDTGFTTSGGPSDFQGLIGMLLDLFNLVIPLLIGIALLGFLWGVAKYIWQADNATAREEGSKAMLYGIIALFVMVSVWGLVAILTNTFGVDTVIPQV